MLCGGGDLSAAAPAVVSLLLDAGLDVNAGDEWGCSPLHLACRALYPAVVSKLLAGVPSDDNSPPPH